MKIEVFGKTFEIPDGLRDLLLGFGTVAAIALTPFLIALFPWIYEELKKRGIVH